MKPVREGSAPEADEQRLALDAQAAARVARVVDAQTGEPLVGVEVWFADFVVLRNERAFMAVRDQFEVEPVVRERGVRVACDEHGLASLPGSDELIAIFAQKAQHVDRGWFPFRAGAQELELAPDEEEYRETLSRRR